jgi:hypothetical protein
VVKSTKIERGEIMSPVDALALFFALWGAILSTVLGVRELRREKRNLRVFLEYVTGYERYQVVIVNTGFRPVTINAVSIEALPAYKGAPAPIDDEMETGPYLTEESEEKLPATLKDGDALTLEVDHLLQDRVSHGKGRLDALVYDAEGNLYKSTTTRVYHDETSQHYNPKKK